MARAAVTYKDRLFNFIFGHEENRRWTLSLYNAVNGTRYDDPAMIEITTIREVLYLGMHNDVSFLIANEMNLYEQQSSYNPNMSLRLMQYAGNLYEKYILERQMNKYGSKLLKLPVPRLAVFYNGTAEQADEVLLRLSDSFTEGAESDIEVRVRMLNINSGHNAALLDDCRPLFEYSWLVRKIREGRDGGDVKAAIDRAISEMPDRFEIKGFLMAHRTEVEGMLLTEYDEKAVMELFKEEGRQEGRQEGRLEGNIEILVKLVKKRILSVAEAARQMEMSEAEFRKYLS